MTLWQPDDDLTPAELDELPASWPPGNWSAPSPADDQAPAFPGLEPDPPEDAPGHLGAPLQEKSPDSPHTPRRSGTGGPLEGAHARGSSVPACVAAIRELLPDGQSMASTELSARLTDLGFSRATIRRARVEAKLQPTKGAVADGGWFVQRLTPPVEDAQATVDDESPWSELRMGGGDGGPPDTKSTNPTVPAHDPQGATDDVDSVALATDHLELAERTRKVAQDELAQLRTQLPKIAHAALTGTPGAQQLLVNLEASIDSGARQVERLVGAAEHAGRLVERAVADAEERTAAARQARIAAARAQRDDLYREIELTVDRLVGQVKAVLVLRTDLADQDERRWVSAAPTNYISRRLHLAGLTEFRLFSGLGERLAPVRKGETL